MNASPSSLRRDVLSAYAASGAKVLSWVIVSAIVFRASPFHYAVLVLIRGTLGLLSYTTVGLAPALARTLAEAGAIPPKPVLSLDEQNDDRVLAYATPVEREVLAVDPVVQTYANGMAVARGAGLVGLLLVVVYSIGIGEVHEVPTQVDGAGWWAFWMGLGFVLRLASEAPAAAIQTRGAIAADNRIQIFAELSWVGLTLLGFAFTTAGSSPRAHLLLGFATVSYAASGLVLCIGRMGEAERVTGIRHYDSRLVNAVGVRRLLAAGTLVSLAQIADFLYAPTDYILINRLISPGAVATYAPAVQIDAALLLVVGAISTVLLPKAAIAHTAGDHPSLRRYFVRGTLVSAGLLLLAGVCVYLISPWIFRLWLGAPLPHTQAILPLVLIHTVIGGSSGVGRAILLGMGRVKPFAIAALVAGAANVVLSYSLVKFFGLGLNGIVYGTILAVVGRCVLWQPWYVMRTLRREAAAFTPQGDVENVPPPEPL